MTPPTHNPTTSATDPTPDTATASAAAPAATVPAAAPGGGPPGGQPGVGVVICAAARTPIGSFQGGLSSLTPAELGAIAAREACARAGVEPAAVDSVVAGTIIPVNPQGFYTSRMIGRAIGVPDTATALNVNRACGSGVQAIISAAQEIAAGTARIALAGGAETMSQAPYSVDGMRAGRRMGDGRLTDWLTGLLTCPFGSGHMGVTAENVAEAHGISRAEQDACAWQSQQRAHDAITQGRFEEQIVPVTVRRRGREHTIDTDEHPRPTTVEALAELPAAFTPGGSVTAGNSSGINDGACMLVLAGEDTAAQLHLARLGRIVAYGIAGVDPAHMGLGPVAAVPKALAAAGLTLDDMDVIESNEAFAAQALAVSRQLGFDEEILNPHGGAIALGHPVGATGAILTTKALYYLKDTGGRYGLITLCIGGGQGIALIVESLAESAATTKEDA
ncbi:acetyl-CoA C-acyltransferase [Corynebacterium sp. 13CS0277]|uniref:acetyl-CoA C-acyltransferase n=1 Tax=Corynebacterium sp. 13CS0277 TaxID=2071994 RepID=UPI000D03E232|nr:acetyl-CoA C-acyltransferase [Corynebacterium sp. 13CS0277]PRQ11642.1 acetyl-CoA C-acyltransferase [Corynebacterium sp. 13CS0277]